MRLKDIFDKISETISSEYKLTALGVHRGLKGTKREKILRNFLRDSLPEQYSLGDGEIFDSEGNVSNQIDIIIHSTHMPVFKYSQYALFYPIESIFGVCEVKTKLDKTTLEEAIKNIQSAKKMKLSKPSIFQGQFHERVYGAVFAFESIDVLKIKKILPQLYDKLKVPKEERINCICVLNKFVMVDNPQSHGWNTPNPTEPIFIKSGTDSLIYFVPTMISGFNKPLSQDFSFFKYIGNLNLPII